MLDVWYVHPFSMHFRGSPGPRGWSRGGGVRCVVAPGILVGAESFVVVVGFRAPWTFFRVVVVSFVRSESSDVRGGGIPCRGGTFVLRV